MDAQDIRKRLGDVEWREKLTDRYFIAFSIVLILGAFLRFNYAFSPGMWVDEGRYGVIAKYLTGHMMNYQDPAHGVITSYPPLYPYLLAISSLIFGKTDFAVRLISPLMGTLGIATTYLLGSKMTSKNVGLAAAALLALSPTYWFMSNMMLVEATLTLFYTATMAALYIGFSDSDYHRYGLWALGPLVALVLMTKQPAFTLGLIIPLYFLYVKREEISELLETRDLRNSSFYTNTLSDINYYIGVGLGILTILPWAVRNTNVCGFPLCGLMTALDFASRNVSSPLADTAGTFFFIKSLPQIVTLPIALLIGIRVLMYVWDRIDENPDYLVKAGSATILLNGVTFFLAPKLFPMTLFTSVAFYARENYGKMLWLWIGIGIGFMSIPQIKVPRYILFTVPAFMILAGEVLNRFSEVIADYLESPRIDAFKVSIVLLIPLLAFSFIQGIGQVQQAGFQSLEPAGEWIAQNSPETASVATTSPEQTRFFVHPRRTYKVPDNETEFRQMLLDRNISYVQVDRYERTQAQWIQLQVPPYRLPNQLIPQLQNGAISPQQVVSQYGQAPEYLVQVQSFGQSRIPLTQNNQQPNSIVYRVNQSALE